MEAEFYNLYVEKILTEITEVTKSKLLLQTQIAWQEKQIQELVELQNKLQQANNELLANLKEANITIAKLTAPSEKPEKKSRKAMAELVIDTPEAEEGF